MSDVETADNNILHLYPAFAAVLKNIIEQANRECAPLWSEFSHYVVFEGYRSQARQTWLYEQGRDRPGSIVTYMQTPKHHGIGLAADCLPVTKGGQIAWDAPRDVLQQFGHCVRAHGFVWGGDWKSIADTPHVEPNSASILAWEENAESYLKGRGLTVPGE